MGCVNIFNKLFLHPIFTMKFIVKFATVQTTVSL